MRSTTARPCTACNTLPRKVTELTSQSPITIATGRLVRRSQRHAEISPHKRLVLSGWAAGTTACYGQKGDTLTYYEIDDAVVKIARNPDCFTFLTNCENRGCPINIVMGDASPAPGEMRRMAATT